ncbi:hypothetical protein A4X06_0g8607, partial [Tilletia controversa]
TFIQLKHSARAHNERSTTCQHDNFGPASCFYCFLHSPSTCFLNVKSTRRIFTPEFDNGESGQPRSHHDRGTSIKYDNCSRKRDLDTNEKTKTMGAKVKNGPFI